MMPNKYERFTDNALRCSFGPIKSLDIASIVQNPCAAATSQTDEDYPEVNNICDLPFKDEDRVIWYMRSRFINKKIYTWAGQTLIALHPYNDIRQHNTNPSINSLITKACFHLDHNLGKKMQILVLSGESGSGKTYSACLAMKYIAYKDNGSNDNPFESVLWKIWSSVPLLSAFGNAPTMHNTNSSRFGKLLQLQYANGNIIGGLLRIYLLEKSRVADPNWNEGNFHIFRQILDSLDEEQLSSLCLNAQTNYKIAPKLNIKSTYMDTLRAFDILGIKQLDNILIILAIILNLGNVCFELSNDAYQISTDTLEYATNVCQLLNTTLSQLTVLLCNVRIYTKCSTIYQSTCVNYDECIERRNCLMKLLYNKLFEWLVDAINAKIHNPLSESYKSLGLLDVYGFEVFDTNRFEQLCINYANERLQQHFINDYLLYKRIELMDEGFDVRRRYRMDTFEYSERVDLIDGRCSLFGILNEECITKRFHDDCYVNARFTETLRGRKHFLGTLNDLQTTFSIRHYAGVVQYDASGMLAKNRDKLPEDMLIFIRNECRLEYLNDLFANKQSPESNGRTLLSNFKKSLDDLTRILKDSDAYYVKCLKPNPYRLADFFDEDFFKQQMLANGIFDIIKLDFHKFTIKLTKKQFFAEFSNDLYNLLNTDLKSDRHESEKHLYLTDGAYRIIDKLKRIKLSIMARKIQFCWLKYQWRRYTAAVIIQKFFRRILYKRLSGEVEEVAYTSAGDNSDGIDYATHYTHRIDQYLANCVMEGDQLSMPLERLFNQLSTPHFKRILFCGDRIISYNRLAEIPVRLHTSRTCLCNSHLLPKSELPSGLMDVFH